MAAMDPLTRGRLLALGVVGAARPGGLRGGRCGRARWRGRRSLYFPREARNRGDRIFDEALLLRVAGTRARFDFVV